jgi:uncharacterized protein YggT (Ycf19 family)
MDQRTLADDEARRHAQHEQVKSRLEGEVHEQIASAGTASVTEKAQVQSVAAQLRQRAMSEVAEAEHELQVGRGAARVAQVVDYLFYVVYGLIGLEIVLELFGARQASGFKRFLDGVSYPFLAPFRGLMPDPSVGSMQLMVSYLVGLVVWMLIHMAVKGLLRVVGERRATI